MSSTGAQLNLLQEPPVFCEYVAGKCDQSFENSQRSECLFLYPTEPQIIANTIDEAISQLRSLGSARKWLSWKDLGVSGQIIFCQICKSMRFTKFIVADVTTLNFNLLFEIGFAIGLGIPVLPVRDTSFMKDSKVFHELGLIDTLGYFDFHNSGELVKQLLTEPPPSPVSAPAHSVDKEKPLYVMKSPIQSEGMVRLMSAVKKSGLRFRSFDPRESSRLSLHEAIKQASSSLGIVIHLMSPDRTGAVAHNARCALVAAGLNNAPFASRTILGDEGSRFSIDLMRFRMNIKTKGFKSFRMTFLAAIKQ